MWLTEILGNVKKEFNWGKPIVSARLIKEPDEEEPPTPGSTAQTESRGGI